MNEISPKYLMRIATEVETAIWREFGSYINAKYYIERWHQNDDSGWENFPIIIKPNKGIDLLSTLNGIDGELLLKIAIDVGVDTPDLIPSIPLFRNEIKSDFKTASSTFEKAFKQIESHPDIAIGLANSALESIIKEIFKDDRITTKPKDGKTLYDLTSELLKEFQLFPESDMPMEMKTIGSSLLAINKSIEKLRSEKTNLHGKTSEDYIVDDSLFTYFIVNSVTTVGLFLNSFYRIKFPKPRQSQVLDDDLPF